MKRANSYYVVPIDINDEIIGEKESCHSEAEARERVVAGLKGGRARRGVNGLELVENGRRMFAVVRETPGHAALDYPIVEYDLGNGYARDPSAARLMADHPTHRNGGHNWFWKMWDEVKA